jgi:hypothetical protein
MSDEEIKSNASQFTRLVDILLGLPWLEAMTELCKAGQKLLRGMSAEGMYEVLEYESALEIKDKRGEQALFRKREKVRYLQNNIIAYQDHAWADGESLINYRCTPGVPVDLYQPGRDTYILISLREVKNRDDVDEFNIQWGIRRGFVRSTELWETEVSHRTRRLKVQLIFPRERPPLRLSLTESTLQRARPLAQDALMQLPDGRWRVTWETSQPRRHERYLIRWDW